jgi:hypothetical protein
VEDCAYKTGETLLAVSTLELIVSIGAYVSMCASTERTNNIATPTLFSDEITTTFIRVKVSDE